LATVRPRAKMVAARFVRKNAATTTFAGYAPRNLNCGPEIATEGLGPELLISAGLNVFVSELGNVDLGRQPEAQWSPRIGIGGVV